MAENKGAGPGLRALGMLAVIGAVGLIAISIGRLLILKAPKVNISCCMVVGCSITWLVLTWVCFNPPDMNQNSVKAGQSTYDYEIAGTELSFSKAPTKPFVVEWRQTSINWILDKNGNTTLLDNGTFLTRSDIFSTTGTVDGKNKRFRLSPNNAIENDYRSHLYIFGDDTDRVAPTRDEFWVGYDHREGGRYAFIEKPNSGLHAEKYFMAGCWIAVIFGGLVYLAAVLEK